MRPSSNASRLKSNFIIVLNDNQMSIAENVGGISQYLNGFRSAEGYNNFKEGVQNTLGKNPGLRRGRLSARLRGRKAA